MRGRPRKPPQLKLLQGNPGGRPVVFGPKFSNGFGSCPKYLKAEAKQGEKRVPGPAERLWRQLSRELDEKGLSAKVFRPMLEGLCYWYGEWRRLIEETSLNGRLKQSQEGRITIRPEYRDLHTAFLNYRLACQEFGLTPATNGKVTVPKSKKQSLRDMLMGNQKPPA